MDFIIGSVLLGGAIVGLMKLFSNIFLETKERREEKRLENWH